MNSNCKRDRVIQLSGCQACSIPDLSTLWVLFSHVEKKKKKTICHYSLWERRMSATQGDRIATLSSSHKSLLSPDPTATFPSTLTVHYFIIRINILAVKES